MAATAKPGGAALAAEIHPDRVVLTGDPADHVVGGVFETLSQLRLSRPRPGCVEMGFERGTSLGLADQLRELTAAVDRGFKARRLWRAEADREARRTVRRTNGAAQSEPSTSKGTRP